MKIIFGTNTNIELNEKSLISRHSSASLSICHFRTHGSLIFREGCQIVDPGKYKSQWESSATAKSFAVEA
jgi:hypothetical protein